MKKNKLLIKLVLSTTCLVSLASCGNQTKVIEYGNTILASENGNVTCDVSSAEKDSYVTFTLTPLSESYEASLLELTNNGETTTYAVNPTNTQEKLEYDDTNKVYFAKVQMKEGGFTVKGTFTKKAVEPVTHVVSSVEELELLRDLFNIAPNAFKNVTIKLKEDEVFDFSDTYWYPMTVGENTLDDDFKFTFDGNNATIKNLVIDESDESCVGFFGYVENFTIKNINFESCDVTGFNSVGVITGCAINSTISNSSVKDSSVYAYGYYAGMVSGTSSNSTVTYCKVKGENAIEGEDYLGGFIGDTFNDNFTDNELSDELYFDILSALFSHVNDFIGDEPNVSTSNVSVASVSRGERFDNISSVNLTNNNTDLGKVELYTISSFGTDEIVNLSANGRYTLSGGAKVKLRFIPNTDCEVYYLFVNGKYIELTNKDEFGYFYYGFTLETSGASISTGFINPKDNTSLTTIHSKEEFIGFNKRAINESSKSQYYNKTINFELKNNFIDLDGYSWTPINFEKNEIELNGNGVTIKNLKIGTKENRTNDTGLFASGYIKASNFNFDQAVIYGDLNVGILVGEAYNAIVKGCTVTNSYIYGLRGIGTLIGDSESNSRFFVCENKTKNNTIIAKYAGGRRGALVGALYDTSNEALEEYLYFDFRDNTIEGTLKMTANSDYNRSMTFIGNRDDDKLSKSNVKSCTIEYLAWEDQ